MSIEGEFNISPENQYHEDPSMPHVSFTEEEQSEMREKFMKGGMTEDEANRAIAEKIANAIEGVTRAQLERESGGFN